MDRSLLKNIIILILLLANGFLLAALVLRQSSAADAQRQTEQQLTELFAADGMALSDDAFSTQTPPASLSLTRSTQLEREVAEFFLGSGIRWEDQGGGTYTCSGSAGAGRFRSNGTFEIAGSLAEGDVETVCRKFCKKFSCEPVTLALDESGSGTASAVCLYREVPVFNAAVTFTVDHGTLFTVSGTLLSSEGAVQTAGQEPLSAAAALTAFQAARRESGAVVSAVTGTTLCYELQTAAAVTLVPAWRITTDTADYYVNCLTGAVTSG